MNKKYLYSYSSSNFSKKEFLTINQIERNIDLLLEYGFPESAKRFREKYEDVLKLKRDDD